MKIGRFNYTVEQKQWECGEIYEHITHNSINIKAFKNILFLVMKGTKGSKQAIENTMPLMLDASFI